MNYRNTVLNVDLTAIKHNYNIYKKETSKHVFAVVKANAYGLGLVDVAKYFESIDVPYICIATLDEAVTLRKSGVRSPLLVMGHVSSQHLQTVKQYNITITLPSLSYISEIQKQEISGLNIHIKVNTSMNRIGLDGFQEVNEALSHLKEAHNVEGIFTHYCCNDETMFKDFEAFKKIVSSLKYDFKYVHASSSNSSLIFKEDFTNSCRVGIGLYGGIDTHDLKIVATLNTEVISIRYVNDHETVSYGGVYKIKNTEKIATLPIGYADGILRSDRGNFVYINDKPYAIVGNICMDQMMIKVDDDVALYDTVQIFGNHTTITEIADKRNTINYEVLTTISNRVPRKYKI